MDRARRAAFWLVILLACYVALVIVIVWSLLAARRWALAEMATAASTQNWEKWRSEVRQQQNEGAPVKRRVPKSAEPPTLVLLRDHFVTMLVGALVFSSTLYWITAWLIVGVLKTPARAAEQ